MAESKMGASSRVAVAVVFVAVMAACFPLAPGQRHLFALDTGGARVAPKPLWRSSQKLTFGWSLFTVIQKRRHRHFDVLLLEAGGNIQATNGYESGLRTPTNRSEDSPNTLGTTLGGGANGSLATSSAFVGQQEETPGFAGTRTNPSMPLPKQHACNLLSA